MPQKFYTGPCEQCGRTTTRKQSSRQGLICTDCGISNALAAAVQMSQKSGPAWDKFVQSLGAAKRRPKPQQRK